MPASGADGVPPLVPQERASIAVGVDTVEVARIAAVVARHGERFLNRVYTAAERAYAGGRTAALAGRFAAKEAAAKALGTGIGQVGWRTIEVRNDASGKPAIILHGEAAVLARAAGLCEWHLSITNTRLLATALVVGYRAEATADDVVQ